MESRKADRQNLKSRPVLNRKLDDTIRISADIGGRNNSLRMLDIAIFAGNKKNTQIFLPISKKQLVNR
jgi:hypothetical protein